VTEGMHGSGTAGGAGMGSGGVLVDEVLGTVERFGMVGAKEDKDGFGLDGGIEDGALMDGGLETGGSAVIAYVAILL
jgi:hypothetical protein